MAVAAPRLEGSVQQPEPFVHAGQPVAAVDGAHVHRLAGVTVHGQIVADGEPDTGVAVVETDRHGLPRGVLGRVDQGLLGDEEQRERGVRGQGRGGAASDVADGDVGTPPVTYLTGTGYRCAWVSVTRASSSSSGRVSVRRA